MPDASPTTTVLKDPTVLARVGKTPLRRLTRLQGLKPDVEIWAKLEWTNPGGSVKDRAALSIIEDAEKSGSLRPGMILLDSTSGNTGIAYALIGSLKGYAVELVMPSNVSEERKRYVREYGSAIRYTSPMEGSDGAIREARRLAAEQPDRYLYLDQYSNPANWQAHYRGTAVEVWEQTAGRVTHLVAGLGTSGTMMGTGRRLKELNPSVRVHAVQPAEPVHGLEGMKHMPSAIVPRIYDEAFPDRTHWVPTEAAYECVKRLAREEGLFVGYSSGAALAAALEVAAGLERGVVVAVFPDSGERYHSTWFYAEEILPLAAGAPPAEPALRMPASAMRGLVAEAERTYPNEACGLFLGKAGRPFDVVRLAVAKNVHPERHEDRFTIAPEEQLKIGSAARKEGLDVGGVFHSHPDHPAVPSATDAPYLELWERCPFVIASVRGGKVSCVRAWVHDGEIREVPVEVVCE
ncbi:MAG: pyridoxal-phosphate dependent enzyme [Planctomycetota bacterium]